MAKLETTLTLKDEVSAVFKRLDVNLNKVFEKQAEIAKLLHDNIVLIEKIIDKDSVIFK